MKLWHFLENLEGYNMHIGLIILVMSWFLAFSGFIGYMLPSIMAGRDKNTEKLTKEQVASGICLCALCLCWVATIIFFVVIV